MTTPWDIRTGDSLDLSGGFDDFYRELAQRKGAGERIRIDLGVLEAMAVLGCIQLALRHPANVGQSAKIARTIAEGLEKMLGTTPAVAEVCKRGWDPKFDT